jgi:hypothetical protein
MPGFGSLVAGRKSGYPQAACTIIGLVISVIGAGRAFAWFAANASRMQNPNGDAFANLAETWMAVRWAVLGLAIFGFASLWALATSLGILAEAKRAEKKGLSVPPKLDGKSVPPKLT